MLRKLFGKKKSFETFEEMNNRTLHDDFAKQEQKTVTDSYLQHAWVSICIDLIMRNVGRCEYEITKHGKPASDSKIANLFESPNKELSLYDLWKQTAAWWSLEGEAFWYFGKDYSYGIPSEIYIVNPRCMSHVVENGRVTRWVYSGDEDYMPFTMLSDEIVHFKQWNPWNRWRGICPLVSVATEIEQDILASRSNTVLLKEGGIPKGLLKTDQIIREDEATELERRWESKYGKGIKNKVAVLGKGTTYQPLTFSPDVLKLYDLKQWNLFTILAKYGIPPRVANIQDSKSSLSGSDTKEQHSAFWKYTLIPLLKNLEQIVNVQLFRRLNLEERGFFNLTTIPELQESEDEQSKRDIAEIECGLKTINDVLKQRRLPTKPWGDTWWRETNLEST